VFSTRFQDRALQLTALCLQFNPANYTVWHFRRQCLKVGLTEDLVDNDLELAAHLGGSNPKNYQIWYHRRALLESFGLSLERARKELDYVGTVLEVDAKNYHAWSHRQWVLRTVDNDDMWNEEMEFGKKTRPCLLFL
jgi:protein farnesyltransferase/geranylgeranyltransferase type-1 subunit alpha